MENASARNMWGDYLDKHLEDAFHDAPEVIHFCDNQKDADLCADLAKKGIKKATTDSLLGLQLRKEALPKIGDFKVVTNWEGEAQCIIKLISVKLKPYFNIDEQYAALEGEGDKSLSYWKKTHWDYYTRELEPFNRKPNESMIVVCQEFEKIF
ncbi:ASCH domain-containing protein [Maribacter sp. PR1]|uniref:ASCH domain-containing protein n=1 Tax=Maribacter cobaltidurans TaxID=1178778 RepID=A0ABU7IZM3_9FLAO|nr:MULTISPECIES: ASCH domain-containing protein [Maribacter]MDC6390922.1 ASCH domain-containing protein [Maribacter sp. PR1]MEE1978314.1 ASCH domain-containing protein [Maribacter cobaltidurans]